MGGGVTYALEASENNVATREVVVQERRGNAIATLYSDGVLEITPIEGTDGKLDYIDEYDGGISSWFGSDFYFFMKPDMRKKYPYPTLKIKKMIAKKGVTLTTVNGFVVFGYKTPYEEIDFSELNISNETEYIAGLIDVQSLLDKPLVYKLNKNWDFSNVKIFRNIFVFSRDYPTVINKEDLDIMLKNMKPLQINQLIGNAKIEHLDLASFDTRELTNVGYEGVFNNIQGLKKITFGDNVIFRNFKPMGNPYDAAGDYFKNTKFTELQEVVMNGNENNGSFIVYNWISDVLFDGKKAGVLKDNQTYALIRDDEFMVGTLKEVRDAEERTFKSGVYKIRPITQNKHSNFVADSNLEYGQRRDGERESVIIDVETQKHYKTNKKDSVIYVGTKPTEVEKRTELSVTEKQTDTLVKGKERITQGRPHIEKEITEYSVNETTGDITESKRIEVVDEGTPTVKEIGTREPNTIIRDGNGKDLTDDELPNYTNPEPNPTNTTDNGDLVYIVHKIITKYKGNDTLELNKQVVEKDGKTDGVKLIQVGTKPTVTTIERDNKQIKQTTTYIVNEDTGELTPNTTEEIIGNVKPTTSNGTESPLTYEIPEYTKPISTNTPIDENDDLILPPTIDKLEYTGTLSTNTPVDDDGELILPPTYHKEEYTQPLSTNTPVDKDDNLILPPTVEIPEYTKPISTKTPVDENGDLILPPIVDTTEYKDDIVNESQKDKKDIKEKLQPKESNKQEPTENTQKLDKQQDVKQDTVNTTESDNNNVVQKQTLPKTNALYISTPYVLGLLLSAIGLKHSKKD